MCWWKKLSGASKLNILEEAQSGSRAGEGAGEAWPGLMRQNQQSVAGFGDKGALGGAAGGP